LLSHITAALFETDNSVPSASIWAEFGEFTGKSDLIRLWGKVRVEMKEGQHLLTEELFIDRRKEVIYNEVAVTAYSNSDVIKAASMHYTVSSKILLLTKPIAKMEI
jgi:LPS export ABC transporter protein LptC